MEEGQTRVTLQFGLCRLDELIFNLDNLRDTGVLARLCVEFIPHLAEFLIDREGAFGQRGRDTWAEHQTVELKSLDELRYVGHQRDLLLTDLDCDLIDEGSEAFLGHDLVVVVIGNDGLHLSLDANLIEEKRPDSSLRDLLYVDVLSGFQFEGALEIPLRRTDIEGAFSFLIPTRAGRLRDFGNQKRDRAILGAQFQKSLFQLRRNCWHIAETSFIWSLRRTIDHTRSMVLSVSLRCAAQMRA